MPVSDPRRVTVRPTIVLMGPAKVFFEKLFRTGLYGRSYEQMVREMFFRTLREETKKEAPNAEP